MYITFCDKVIANDPGFTLGLPMWMLYHDMLQAVAERVSVDQRKLQIYFSVKYVHINNDIQIFLPYFKYLISVAVKRNLLVNQLKILIMDQFETS